MTTAGMHQIGEVADLTGLSLRTIRHYEEVDLVPPSGRTTGGFRLYTDADIERLLVVKHLKPLKFTLEETREIVEALDVVRAGNRDGDVADVDVAAACDRLGALASSASERCDRVRDQLRAAEALTRTLHQEAAGDHRAP